MPLLAGCVWLQSDGLGAEAIDQLGPELIDGPDGRQRLTALRAERLQRPA